MNQNTTTRLDPMNNVMPYELLKAAHELMLRRPNQGYWVAVPVPKRPVGQVRFEVARQVATFAVPLLGLAMVYLAFGLKALVFGLPVAWAVGFLLDLQLKKAIARRTVHDLDIDRGRYNTVNYLAKHMGMAPSEVTLEVIHKMAADFRMVDAPIRAAAEREEADRKAAIARSVSRRGGRGNAAAGVAAAATSTADAADELPFAYLGNFNPTTGLPMMPGTTLDVHGNGFGTGSLVDVNVN
jgi:hypothetical protein